MSKYTDFGQRLTWYRSKAKMTQRALAERSGVSLPQITRYETNKSAPRLAAVMKIAEALEVPVEVFTDPKPVPNTRKAVIAFPDGKEVSLLVPAEFIAQIETTSAETGKAFEQCFAELFDALVKSAHKQAIADGMKPRDKA